MKKYKTLQDLGIEYFHKTSLEWRNPWEKELKSDALVGKSFRIGRRIKTAKTYLHKCLGSDWVSSKKPSLIKYKHGEVEASATFFVLPTNRQKTAKEIENEILLLYKNSKLYIPSTGCQMHGEIDAKLILEDGTLYFIPWNY